MELVFLTTDLDYGGAETQVVHLGTQLRGRGWRVRVVSMLAPRAYTEELRDIGIPLATLNMRRGTPDPRGLLGLARILRQQRPTVVHSHMDHANLLARLARLLVPIPCLVCTVHNTGERGRKREWAFRLTDSLADLTTQVSRAGLERYVQVGAVPRHKIRFVPNGVDTKRFRPNPAMRMRLRSSLDVEDRFVWLAVGRFEGPKDYPNMLRAFARVAAAGTASVLLIAGQGCLKQDVERLATELGIDFCVRFLGVRRDVPELVNAADAYVMSSSSEGLPMVLLEAGATGLPAVATRVGGVPELVEDGKSGFLVPPKDPEALAGAMLRLKALPQEARARMGEAGRAHIEANYSLERVVDMWEALYQELLKRKGIRV